MHTLLIKASAEKDLRKLPPDLFQRVNDRILSLRDDPHPAGSVKLSGRLEGWRVRVGDYRILYQIDDAARTVTIVRVKHRREVYR
jgi:mRNA interferase RelE/StbE